MDKSIQFHLEDFEGPLDLLLALVQKNKMSIYDIEILTIIEGEGANAGDPRQITEWLKDQRAHVTAEIHHGGQPLYPYYFGVE